MLEFLTGWEFWVGGAVFGCLMGYPAWKLGYAAGRIDEHEATEIMQDGEWIPAASLDPQARKGATRQTVLYNVRQFWTDKRG